LGAAIVEIPASTLAPYGAHLAHKPQTELKSKETPLLVRLSGEQFGGMWRVMKASEVRGELMRTVKHGGVVGDMRSVREQIFVLNIANVCDSIFDRLQRYWKDEL
jgi:hypothetical protein